MNTTGPASTQAGPVAVPAPRCRWRLNAGWMNRDDEHLLRGRVYGHDHADPNPGPLPWQTYAATIGGPLDGLLLDITR